MEYFKQISISAQPLAYNTCNGPKALPHQNTESMNSPDGCARRIHRLNTGKQKSNGRLALAYGSWKESSMHILEMGRLDSCGSMVYQDAGRAS